MRKVFRYLPIVLLCTALFTGYGLKAQENFNAEESTPLPDKIDGNWALPDCRSYEEALIITHHFYLKSTPKGSQLWLVESFGKEKDYWLLTMEGEKRPVRLEEDGILTVGILAPAGPKQWPKEWDALDLERKREYMGCADPPSLLPIPLIRVMARLDDIENACGGRTMDGVCKSVLFDVADDDKDKKISSKEIQMAGAMLAGFAALTESHSVAKEQLDKIFYAGMTEGERLASALMEDKDELAYEDFTGFPDDTPSDMLQTSLQKIGVLFPTFTPAPPPPAAGGRLSPSP